MQIGPHFLENQLMLAPMAGITDRPFRNLCRDFGAGLAVSEMVSSNPALRKNKRTLLKAEHGGENGLKAVQILGTEPSQMADAARFNRDKGADIIDINMGCPAKKVCAVAAGSALMKNETLVADILEAVVKAVDIPVTLKIRTGWNKENRNAANIARIAQDCGIAALTIHGRTRTCKFEGHAEYDTIKQVKRAVSIPVIANGDIDSPKKARFVLDYTGADAIMIGRAAQGRPWIFRQLQAHLDDKTPFIPDFALIYNTIITHLDGLHDFYGDNCGVRMARKHIGWYFAHLGIAKELTQKFHKATTPEQQTALLEMSFDSFLNNKAA